MKKDYSIGRYRVRAEKKGMDEPIVVVRYLKVV